MIKCPEARDHTSGVHNHAFGARDHALESVSRWVLFTHFWVYFLGFWYLSDEFQTSVLPKLVSISQKIFSSSVILYETLP